MPSTSLVFEKLAATRLAAVATVSRVDHATRLAQALVEGGVHALELTLRTECALEAIYQIRHEVPSMTVGAGTVLSPDQAEDALRAGAQFGVSPGCNPRTVKRARELGLPFAPGVATPSDIELGLEQGCRFFKFFPSAPLGGLKYLECMAVPFVHLGVRFMPLGGVNADNLADHLRSPLVACVGGSWIAPTELLASGDWDGIRARAAAARAIVDALGAA